MRTHDKRAVTPQKTEPDWSVSRSLWQRCGLTVACNRVKGTNSSSYGRWHVLAWVFLDKVNITLTIILPQIKLQGGNIGPPSAENWVKDLLSIALPIRARLFPPQPALPIRKLAQASYSHPSEEIQNENDNHRKLNKIITWITALHNWAKLWTMPRSTTQDRCVIVESSDKM